MSLVAAFRAPPPKPHSGTPTGYFGEKIMVTMLIKNKFFSLRGHSTVTDVNGNPLFEVKGTLTLWKRKKIKDLDGNVLYTVRNKMIKFFMNSAFVFDAQGKKVARLKQKFRLTRSEYYLIGYKDELSIEGNFFQREINVIRNGEVIASGSRKLLTLVDSFTVTVNNDEDAPFVLALFIAMDNINDKNISD